MQLEGTVATQPQPGQHRPLAAAVAGAATAVLVGCAVIDPPDPPELTGPSPDGLVALLAALLAPLLNLALVPMVILGGIYLMATPFRRRSRGWGLAAPGSGLLVAAVAAAVRLLAAAATVAFQLLRLLLTLVAAPRSSVTFTVADPHGVRWQVRLLQPALGLAHGDAVEVRGLLVAGVLHASSVRVAATRVVLRPRTAAASVVTGLLVLLAAGTLFTAWTS